MDRAVELVLPGPDVVLPAVPRAAQDRVLEPAFTERPSEMEARVLRREELAADVRVEDGEVKVAV